MGPIASAGPAGFEKSATVHAADREEGGAAVKLAESITGSTDLGAMNCDYRKCGVPILKQDAA